MAKRRKCADNTRRKAKPKLHPCIHYTHKVGVGLSALSGHLTRTDYRHEAEVHVTQASSVPVRR